MSNLYIYLYVVHILTFYYYSAVMDVFVCGCGCVL